MVADPPFTLGIEEEYLLVDAASRDLVRETPPSLLSDCEQQVGGQVTAEFMQSQIEVGTAVCTTTTEALDELRRLRRTIASVANEHGCAIIAASTHPFGRYHEQRQTERERYRILAHDLQEVGRRLLICGMHVHVGIENDDLRADLMSQATYVLPHLLALSTSSPFWEGHDTGLMSYRVAVWDELPRTGLPEAFESYGEYQRHVDALIGAGVIDDASKIWWDIRPNARFPTLEMRLTDIATRAEDTVCIAAIFRCWLRMLYRLRRANQRWRRYSAMLIRENRWLAQRYGIDEGLVDFGRGEMVAYPDLLEEILEMIREDAEHFGCVAEIEHARTILKRGTSAHWQRDTYRKARAEGADDHEALVAVVDMLIEETVR